MPQSVSLFVDGISGIFYNIFFPSQITIGGTFKMVQKQPFDDGEPLEISSKRLKQVVEQSNQILSFSESVIPEDSLQYHYGLGAGLATILCHVEGFNKCHRLVVCKTCYLAGW